MLEGIGPPRRDMRFIYGWMEGNWNWKAMFIWVLCSFYKLKSISGCSICFGITIRFYYYSQFLSIIRSD